MARIIVAEGDSWTAGDILDPELAKKGVTYVNDPRNDEYRLPKVWPAKLGALVDTEVLNYAVAGSSNEGILRRLYNNMPEIIKKYRRKDITVVIGLSSPERRDFCGEKGWDVIYPAELKFRGDEESEYIEFLKLYAKLYWNSADIVSRYINTVLSIYYYLKLLKVNFVFFNAFYENSQGLKNKKTVKSFVQEYNSNTGIGTKKHIQINNSIKEYLILCEKYFLDKSFLQLIKENATTDNKDYFDHYHPTELSHKMWAVYLYANLFLEKKI